MPQNNDNNTTSTAVRYEYTNDLLAGLLILSTVGAVGGSLYLTGSVPGRLVAVFAFESLLAAGWAFGRETLSAVADVVPNPMGGQPRRPAPEASRTPETTASSEPVEQRNEIS